MFFNSEAYKQAFPKVETKPNASAAHEKTCETYDEGDNNDATLTPEQITARAGEVDESDDGAENDDGADDADDQSGEV